LQAEHLVDEHLVDQQVERIELVECLNRQALD